MIRASGILFLCGNSALFLRRGASSDQPGTWCLPGGCIEQGETAEAAAAREAYEEVGYRVKPEQLRPWTRTVNSLAAPEVVLPEGGDPASTVPDEVDFETFLVRLSEPFTPHLSDEHDGYAWAPVAGPPQPLHPGVQISLDRLQMDELGVARAMAAGLGCQV